MLQFRIPANRKNEGQWLGSILLGEILGLDFVTVPSLEPGYSFCLEGKQLDLPDVFFSRAASCWLQPESLAPAPLAQWDVTACRLHVPLITEPLPVLFGKPGVEFGENRVCCHVDILGTAFYLLSRYEEVVEPYRDAHDRFPARASLAYEAGFLCRPIVDEYVELLWACMKHLWPELKRKACQGRVRVTCDVDAPFDCGMGDVGKLARALGGDLLKRRDVSQGVRRIRNFFASRRGDYSFDSSNTFDWYMDTCELHGRQAAFYFIADHSAGMIDGCYDLNEPRIQSLIRMISTRGHEVGVHGSYNTYRDGAQVAKERQLLISACQQARADASVRGNRQHFLRWDTTQTPDHLDAAGFEYDTSGTFADMPGFRYGTAHSFNMWSWQKNAPLKIRQRPLVVMECSVISERYLNLGYTAEALALMLALKQQALRFGGDFSLLWHNSHLATSKDREFFEELIR